MKTMKTKEYLPQCGDGSHGSPRFIKELYEFLNPKSLVLDIGSGFGYKTEYMIHKDLEVISFDVDILSLRKLRMRCENSNAICGDAKYLPFKSSVFNNILASEILEHLPEPELCISEVHRVMKDNGVAVFTTPVFNLHIKYIIKVFRLICGIDQRSHLHVFSTNQLKNHLSKYYIFEDILHRGFTEVLYIKFNFDENGRLDKKIIKLSKKFRLINLFATKVWIKVKK
ncbi:MAG: class I SAM-dependent methyltransferase [Candidatus Methanoperedens sp.]